MVVSHITRTVINKLQSQTQGKSPDSNFQKPNVSLKKCIGLLFSL